MSVRIKRWPNTLVDTSPDANVDSNREQREVTVDGITYHFGTNEVKNFLDDGVGAAVGAFSPGSNVVENPIPFGSSRS